MDQHGWLATLAGYGTLFFETTFILAVATRRVIMFYAVAGLMFHAAIFLTMRAHFFETTALYCVFFDRIRPFFRGLSTRT